MRRRRTQGEESSRESRRLQSSINYDCKRKDNKREGGLVMICK